MNKKSKKVKTMYKNMEYAPDYQPNHEIVKRQLGSCGTQFQNIKGRQPIYRISSAASEKFFF